MGQVRVTGGTSRVSIVVPAHNASRFIEPCLRAALLTAAPRGWEVLVVDDGSTDDTVARVEALGVRTLRHAESRGAAAARNHGARVASGDILVFLDSDVVVQEDTLPRLVDRLQQDPDVHATGAHASPRNLSPEFSADFVALRHSHAFYCQEMPDIAGVSCFQSECGAIRREVFEEIGRFPERYSGAGMEDYAFGHELERRGFNSVLLAGAAYDHHYRSLWPRCREVCRRSARWLPLALKRRKWESQGMGASPRDSLSFVLSVVLFAGVAGGLLHPWGWYLAAAAALAQILLEIPFLRFARREYGTVMMLYAWPALQVFHGAIALGFACGAALVVQSLFEPRDRRVPDPGGDPA